ncbi:UDP-N-acetylmuramate--L-alanine ligase [Persicobacter diffluens]|uniref:Peptidoglycan synthetase n=1 Tax=Persicobacter diffluens TaxID=981 RepID=A0AAN4VZ95_9BACT|nr:peptidoglycan synthetase [Persicobacter diffluens]
MTNHNSLKIHLIAVGGAIMHNLAIALKRAGHQVTGSDDEIFDPAKSALETEGLLPEHNGWNPENIHAELDAIILGMHAREDNPELAKAQELGLKIYSFPEFIFEQSKNKQRVVIAGSHGKTSITAMVMHVLNFQQKEFDYLVGSKVKGFDLSVQLSDAPVIIIEGDEYLNSTLDRVPKFLKYHHHIALISGIAWDHFNVFPTYEGYVQLFHDLADQSPKAGSLIYNEKDPEVKKIGKTKRTDVNSIPYKTHPYTVENGQTFLKTDNGKVAVNIIGEHNMENLAGAKAICKQLGITDAQFYEAMATFESANKRLTPLKTTPEAMVYQDFAHSPSKVMATTKAVAEQFKDRNTQVLLELHTFSSLNKDFLPQYAGALDSAKQPIILVNEQVLQHKGLPAISEEEIKAAFKKDDIQYVRNAEELKAAFSGLAKEGNLLIMTSGNLAGVPIMELADDWTK